MRRVIKKETNKNYFLLSKMAALTQDKLVGHFSGAGPTHFLKD